VTFFHGTGGHSPLTLTQVPYTLPSHSNPSTLPRQACSPRQSAGFLKRPLQRHGGLNKREAPRPQTCSSQCKRHGYSLPLTADHCRLVYCGYSNGLLNVKRVF